MRHLASTCLGLLLLYAGATNAQAATSVPLGGNAYVTRTSSSANELINDTGLHNWSSSQATISTYFYVQQAGNLELSLGGSLNGASHSKVKVTLGDQSRTVDLYSTATSPFAVGAFNVDAPGYVKVDLQGVSTDGGYYGDISDLQIDGAAASGAVFADDPENFYWSRRGPSVHLDYDVPANTEYFYSEITVPSGKDPVGTYYMANGFNNGYFGIQVVSSTERWVLFSVWDSPTGATTLVSKGANVVSNTFGGEGTGGQSYLVYPWEAGKTYRFLTRAQPDGDGNMLYSAWFSEVPGTQADSDWKFIATWKYLDASAYPSSMYSFLEGFNPDTGYLERGATFGNQWAVSTGGAWTEITAAYYDADSTGLNQQRLDFAGGVSGNAFHLRNDGFFTGTVPSGQHFTRGANGTHPNVNFSQLP